MDTCRQVVIVSAAAREIGASIGRRLAAAGFTVVVNSAADAPASEVLAATDRATLGTPDPDTLRPACVIESVDRPTAERIATTFGLYRPSDQASLGARRSRIAKVRDHVLANLGQRHTLRSLAAEAGMSARNLARQFVQETGITPHEFVQRARVRAACRLLQSTDLALKAIAYDCGFGTPDRMRIVFSARLGVTPAQYRANVRPFRTTGQGSGVEHAWRPVVADDRQMATRIGSIRDASDRIERLALSAS